MGRRSSIVIIAEGAKDVNGVQITSHDVKDALDKAGNSFSLKLKKQVLILGLPF
jgi:hypothetical protein